MAEEAQQQTDAVLTVRPGADGAITVALGGRLDAHTTGRIWRGAVGAITGGGVQRVDIDASGVTYCDGAGVGLILDLQRQAARGGATAQVPGLADALRAVVEQFDPHELDFPEGRTGERSHVIVELGRGAARLWADVHELVSFIGEVGAALVAAIRHPRKVRWRDAFLYAEKVGANALPIVVLIGFLLGLVLAFQAAITLKMFGAEVFVATLISLGLARELGPVITAILLAGRSGSAFAAELGTMAVTEELSALKTMGLDPVRFLVVTRVLAAVVMMPFLTVFFDLAAMVGGALVNAGMGYPLVTYVNKTIEAVNAVDFIGGLAKSLVLGLLVGAVGCLRGLQTKTGPSAVGDAATSAVVSGFVLIAVADGVLAVVYYYLGI